MTTFVLVHGAWRGSWLWKRVRKHLQAGGHDVFTPTLTGLADRSHLLTPEVDLTTHITDVLNLILWEELHDVVLCGHSYAGAVVTGAADRVPERIRALIYLDAFVPGNGESVLQHVPAEQLPGLRQATDEIGDGWKVPPIPAAMFNVNERDRDWVDRQCTPQPFATFEQPLRLSGGIDKIAKIVYVRATGFEEGSPFPAFEKKARGKGWQMHRLDCGHDVPIDRPEELAALLAEV